MSDPSAGLEVKGQGHQDGGTYKLAFELKGNLTTTQHPAQPLLRTRRCLDNSNIATVT